MQSSCLTKERRLGLMGCGGKVPPDDDETIQIGEMAFLQTNGSERAQALAVRPERDLQRPEPLSQPPKHNHKARF